MVSKQLQKILTIYILLKKIRTNQVTIYNTSYHTIRFHRSWLSTVLYQWGLTSDQ